MRMKTRPSGAPRTAATRQASITFARTQPEPRACRPYSPNETTFPRDATPWILPRCDFRYFTRLGIIAMSDARLAAGLRGGEHAGVDPHLHADRAVRGLRRGGAVVDVGLEGGQRDRAADLLLDARDLRAAEAAAHLHLDALRAALHRLLDRALHRAAERGALDELLRDALGDERGVELGLGDLEDVEADLAREQRLEALLELLGLDALAADEDAGLRRVDDDPEGVRLALDLDLGDPRARELLLDEVADDAVLAEEAGEVLLRGVPPRLPVEVDAGAEADRMGLLSHDYSFSCDSPRLPPRLPEAGAAAGAAAWPAGTAPGAVSAFLAPPFFARALGSGPSSSVTVMWQVRLRIGNARPIARGMKRGRPPGGGPASTTAARAAGRASFTSRSLLALASAERMTLRIIGAARRGCHSRIERASSTLLPRTRSMTGRALYGERRA